MQNRKWMVRNLSRNQTSPNYMSLASENRRYSCEIEE